MRQCYKINVLVPLTIDNLYYLYEQKKTNNQSSELNEISYSSSNISGFYLFYDHYFVSAKAGDKNGSDLARIIILHSEYLKNRTYKYSCSPFGPLYCPRAGKVYIEIRSVKGFHAKQRP